MAATLQRSCLYFLRAWSGCSTSEFLGGSLKSSLSWPLCSLSSSAAQKKLTHWVCEVKALGKAAVFMYIFSNLLDNRPLSCWDWRYLMYAGRGNAAPDAVCDDRPLFWNNQHHKGVRELLSFWSCYFKTVFLFETRNRCESDGNRNLKLALITFLDLDHYLSTKGLRALDQVLFVLLLHMDSTPGNKLWAGGPFLSNGSLDLPSQELRHPPRGLAETVCFHVENLGESRPFLQSLKENKKCIDKNGRIYYILSNLFNFSVDALKWLSSSKPIFSLARFCRKKSQRITSLCNFWKACYSVPPLTFQKNILESDSSQLTNKSGHSKAFHISDFVWSALE